MSNVILIFVAIIPATPNKTTITYKSEVKPDKGYDAIITDPARPIYF